MFIQSRGDKGDVLPRKKYLKPIIVGAALAVAFTIGAGSVSAESSLSTVYHIYVNEEYIGTVNNKEQIEKLKNEKLQENKREYSNLNLTLENIEVIPEQMFRPVFNNEITLEKLGKELDVVVESTELIINNQVIANFNSRSDAEAVLNAYKFSFVSNSVLEELKIREQANIQPSSLQEGQSRTLDVTFSEDVSLGLKKVSPDKILTVEQGINLLKTGIPKTKTYKVQEDEVLGSIASDHQITLEQLLTLNPGLKKDSVIKPGDTLNVTVLTPIVHVTEKIEALQKETISFETEVVEDAAMAKGEQKTTQVGQNGEKLVNYLIYKENGTEVKREITSEQSVKEPVKEIIVKGTKVIPSRGTGTLKWPANGGYVSSGLGQRWGKLHKGIDIARPSDLTIKAADNGKVISAEYSGGYGNKVVIDHNNGLQTVYAHLDSIAVSAGQVVSQGQKLGVMGNTGNSTGTHLHFEVYENGALKNPMDYLN